MTQHEEKAAKLFKSNFNCAQSVFSAFSDDLKIDNEMALKVSCGFGGGMGRLQETCGAVTGAFMAISLYTCNKYKDNSERKSKSYAMIQNFNKKFVDAHKTTNCKALLNCDLNTKEGTEYANSHKLFETICAGCISTSIKILEEQFQDK